MNKKDITKNISIAPISTTLSFGDMNFFKLWLEFLRPLHRLPNREMMVLAALLKRRFELSRTIMDEETLDKVLFTNEVKKGIASSLEISSNNLQSVLTNLRKVGIITNNTINKRFIPSMDIDADNYKLILHFKINHDK